ncbi:secreted Ly-6/uPAR-related protein 1 [Sorex araneus]|uniref:secreted Ly-6/uPAR-related protein 1 n=1 Tax=Sorex araneus TaxID=42254 RepID=UPI0024338DC6|nr:secreted Ly-6/uPAR-related protein 1 [Sorex araneus]
MRSWGLGPGPTGDRFCPAVGKMGPQAQPDPTDEEERCTGPPSPPVNMPPPRPHPGEAFRCFTCEQPTVIEACRNITRCGQEHTACSTSLVMGRSEFPFNQSPLVIRSCSSSCKATDPDSIGDAHLIRCCFQDLCNSMGTASPGIGVLATLGTALLGLVLP